MRRWEISSTLINSAVFAGFITLWLPFLWSHRTLRTSGILGAALAGLVLSRSATAVVAIAIAIIVTVVVDQDKSKRLRTAIRSAGAILVLVGTILIVKEFLAPAGMSYHVWARVNYWKTAFVMAMHHPGSGIGLGAYGVAYPWFQQAVGEHTVFVHSWPLQVFAETGVWGLAGWGWILTTAFRQARRSFSQQETYVWATWAAVLTFSMVSILMDYWVSLCCLSLWLAPAWIGQPAPSVRLSPVKSVVAAGVVLSLSAFWLSLFQAERCFAEGLLWEKQQNLTAARQSYMSALDLNSRHGDAWWRLAAFATPQEAPRLREKAFSVKHYLQR